MERNAFSLGKFVPVASVQHDVVLVLSITMEVQIDVFRLYAPSVAVVGQVVDIAAEPDALATRLPKVGLRKRGAF
jgi:hypothetical protein